MIRVYDGETGALIEEIETVALVPASVTARQMKLALLGADLIDDIEAFVSSQDRGVQISWEYATEFHRGDELLAGMAKAFGMTEEQVDEIFRTAAGL